MSLRFSVFSILLFFSLSATSWGFELQTLAVNERVYALVGSTDARTPENHGLNNTLGFIVGKNGVVLVSSGTGLAAVTLIRQAIAEVTPLPITDVINISSQDHHWMGNAYFTEQGAKTWALQRTVQSQQDNLDGQLTRLQAGIGAAIDTVKPQTAQTVMAVDQHRMTLQGIKMELRWPGKGHFPGDAILWLEDDQVLFSGDFVYRDRMLGVSGTSDSVAWNQSFEVIASYPFQTLIPGHGRPATLAEARRDSGDYLSWLVAEVGAAIEDWQDIEETIESLADAPAFKHLKHYDDWHRRNIHRTYLLIESMQ